MFSKKKEVKAPSRFKRRKCPKLAWNNLPLNRRTYVFYGPGGNFELPIMRIIIKTFRRRSRRRGYRLNFFFKPNYFIFRKGKNARMGKGKGRFKRLSLNLRKNKLFMAISGLSHTRVLIFFKNISRKTNLRFVVSRNRYFYGR